MVRLARGGGLRGVSTCFFSGCKSYEGGGVGNFGCWIGGCTGLDGVELISIGERLRCRSYDISVRKNRAFRRRNVTSVVLGLVSAGSAVGGSGVDSRGASKVIVCWVVTGSCGGGASDIGSGSGEVPMLV